MQPRGGTYRGGIKKVQAGRRASKTCNALRLARGEVLGSVAIPGLGTGVGGMSADACARQVALAIEEMVRGEDPHHATWQDARDRHLWMAGGGEWPPGKGRA